jgi:hypothetical protein
MGQIKHNSHQRSVSMIAVAILLLAALPLVAQTPTPAPIPAQFATAKTVFLSNAGPQDNVVSERAYTTFYTGLTQWNHYQLVTAPANAELVLELRYTAPLSNISVMSGGSFPPSYRPQFQLIIIDRATGVILWSSTETPFGTRKQNTNDNAVNALLADLKALVSGQFPSVAAAAAASAPPAPVVSKPAPSPKPTATPKKTRLSDEK